MNKHSVLQKWFYVLMVVETPQGPARYAMGSFETYKEAVAAIHRRSEGKRHPDVDFFIDGKMYHRLAE